MGQPSVNCILDDEHVIRTELDPRSHPQLSRPLAGLADRAEEFSRSVEDFDFLVLNIEGENGALIVNDKRPTLGERLIRVVPSTHGQFFS